MKRHAQNKKPIHEFASNMLLCAAFLCCGNRVHICVINRACVDNLYVYIHEIRNEQTTYIWLD